MASVVLVNIGSSNGLSPIICQAITWTKNKFRLIKDVYSK